MTNPPRMLALVSGFKWTHINYVRALSEQFDLRVAWSGEVGSGALEAARGFGVREAPIGAVRQLGPDAVRPRLREAIEEWRPEIVHSLFHFNEELTVLARELADRDTLVVHESRDPLTTLNGARPGDRYWTLEADALRASDAQLFVTRALRSYLERSHGLDLEPTSLVVPQGFARDTIVAPSPKLSARDGRVHIALVGSVDVVPDHGRWYGDIIRRLVSLGLVVHSHFFEVEDGWLEPYRALARELDDYHLHPTVSHVWGTELSATASRYDLMGVFHELEASEHNESATLAVCLPTKAVCGWLHAGIPVVCFPHYRGVVELIEEFDIGFVIEDWEDLRAVAADRGAIAASTQRAVACRDRFTNEHNVRRIRDFLEPRLARRRLEVFGLGSDR